MDYNTVAFMVGNIINIKDLYSLEFNINLVQIDFINENKNFKLEAIPY